jgi:hypothetical protein
MDGRQRLSPESLSRFVPLVRVGTRVDAALKHWLKYRRCIADGCYSDSGGLVIEVRDDAPGASRDELQRPELAE